MAKKKKEKEIDIFDEPSHRLKGLSLLACSSLALACLLTFHDGDSSYNLLGLVGYVLSWLLLWSFGVSSYLFIGFCGWIGWRWSGGKPTGNLLKKSLLLITSALSLSLLATLASYHYASSIPHLLMSC